MPGPCNSKKKKKVQAKKDKQAKTRNIDTGLGGQHAADDVESSSTTLLSAPPHPTLCSSTSSRSVIIATQQTCNARQDSGSFVTLPMDDQDAESRQRFQQYLESRRRDQEFIPEFLKKPCVEDLGNGPRVRDIKAFLSSKIATPPSYDDPLCAEFAQTEVLEMLCAVIPEETAMIVWYNYSRLKSRICPACRRLYHLGDTPRDPLIDYNGEDAVCEDSDQLRESGKREESRRLHEEQSISGICSALCYLLVSHNYPGAIRSTYGRRAEHISDEVWDELEGPGAGTEDRLGLGTMLKMTRCHDLGLQQLLFPDVDWESEVAPSSSGSSGPPSPILRPHSR